MTWRKWNMAAGWCQKSEEKRRKLSYFWQCYHHWDVVEARQGIQGYHWWPLNNIYQQYIHHPSWSGLEKGRILGCVSSCMKSSNQPPRKGALKGFFVPSTHRLPTSIWCIFSGSQMRRGTFGQLFSISSFCSNSWSNAHRRLRHPKKRCNSDLGIFLLLFKKDTNAPSICINLAQAFDDISCNHFAVHMSVGCSIHLAIDIWIIWDINTSTTVWSVAKQWRCMRMIREETGTLEFPC